MDWHPFPLCGNYKATDPRVAQSVKLYNSPTNAEEKNLSYLNWLRERWAAASVAKKCTAAAGFAILGMALSTMALLGTQLTRKQIGFCFLGVETVTLVAIIAVAIYEGRRYPRQFTSARHPAGRPDVTQATWNAARDENLLVGSSRGVIPDTKSL